ncbi:MAG: hypothetical protein V1802_00115 [Candidatus Aenigmatarchaeota archaeon]
MAKARNEVNIKEIKILRKISKALGVAEEDIPKTLERFKRETEDMENLVKK